MQNEGDANAIHKLVAMEVQRELEHYTRLVAEKFLILSAEGSILATGGEVTVNHGGTDSKKSYTVVLASGGASNDLRAFIREQSHLRSIVIEAAGGNVVRFDEHGGGSGGDL